MSGAQKSSEVQSCQLLSLSVADGLPTTFTAYRGGTLRSFTCEPLKQVHSPPRGMRIRAAEGLLGHGLWAVASEFRPESVTLWSDVRGGQVISRTDYGGQPVLSLRLREEFLVVVTEGKATVVCRLKFEARRVVETCPNPTGLCEVSDPKRGITAMAFPGEEEGRVRVEFCSSQGFVIDYTVISAHCSSLGCLALSDEGRFLATASVKGTLIRVFRTLDGVLLQGLRRGVERAVIQSMRFSKTSVTMDHNDKWLAVSSDKGTVHVFNLNLKYPVPSNSLLSLSLIKGAIPDCFTTVHSVAQFRVPKNIKSLVAFGQEEHTIIIVSTNGSFYRCKFDPVKGGTMTEIESCNFLNQEGPN